MHTRHTVFAEHKGGKVDRIREKAFGKSTRKHATEVIEVGDGRRSNSHLHRKPRGRFCKSDVEGRGHCAEYAEEASSSEGVQRRGGGKGAASSVEAVRGPP
ncbi:unnamed protein product [Calypogeia fissa]